jgi:hypothetical protein
MIEVSDSTMKLQLSARQYENIAGLPKMLEAVSKPDCRYFNGREFAFV